MEDQNQKMFRMKKNDNFESVKVVLRRPNIKNFKETSLMWFMLSNKIVKFYRYIEVICLNNFKINLRVQLLFG